MKIILKKIPLKQIFGSLILWRILLTIVVISTIQQLPFEPTFPYARELLTQYGPRLLTTFAQFDGVHYLTIIEKGYEGTGLIQAFFPLYPLLVRWLSFDALNPVIVGQILSTASFFVGLIMLFKLLRLDESDAIAKKTIWLLLLFPTAFFFTSLYTEGLFFLTTVASFYAARKGNWWLAGSLGMLASLTRLTGVVLFPALAYEWWHQRSQSSTKPTRLTALSTALPLVGLGIYMYYLHDTFHNALMFMDVQSEFGAERETGRLILLYQVFYRYARMVMDVPKTSGLFYTVMLELLSGLYGTIIGLLSFFKIRTSYAIYAIVSFLLPTLTGTFSSVPRYVLVLFPLHLVLVKLLPDKLYRLVLLISAILLGVNLMLFTQGKWVA